MTASEKVKLWRIKNPDRLKAQWEKWNRSDAARRAKRKWEQSHKAEIADQRNRRLQASPRLRMEKSLRVRMRFALRAVGARKTYSSSQFLGCSPRKLRAHLESKFRDGMTWENYGSVWHVDHIIPCSRFDLTDPRQQLTCFRWTNLQPLLAEENLRKSDIF